jgi:hypothetical protein
MQALDEAERIREQFIEGKIPAEDLLLHLEPVLSGLASDSQAQADVRRMVNGIEKLIFTQADPQRHSLIAEQLAAATAWIRSHS